MNRLNFTARSVWLGWFCIAAGTHSLGLAEDQQRVAAWPQGTGPSGDFVVADAQAPVSWSVVQGRNIKWTKTLPETGQSTPTIDRGRVFFTTMATVERDAELGSDIVAWCCDEETGQTIWQHEIHADYPLRLSGCFSDSSAPPPVSDGERVVFFNASGRITCFSFAGDRLWSIDAMPVGRTQPFLVDREVVYIRQRYMPDDHGHFTHEHQNAPRSEWTQLQALDMQTGEVAWTSRCGVNMGCVPLIQLLSDGRRVIGVGRGGGHSPPEHPEGVSLLSADSGQTLWTTELDGFMSTMSLHVHSDHMLVFHDDEHLWLDADDGRIVRRVSILADADVCRSLPLDANSRQWHTGSEQLPPPNKKRAIIQQSNILVGDYHYFRSYSRPYLGRVHVVSGKVEYLQLPVQLKRAAETEDDRLLWDWKGMDPELVERLLKAARKRPERLPIHQWAFLPNEVKNSRGLTVMGDRRSMGTGWGHHASQVPTVVGERLYVPIMNGTVYVMDWQAERLDQDAILAINDLGPVGQSFNRASLSAANGKLFAHTIRQLICIGD